MNIEMEKANLLARNILTFIKFVQTCHDKKNSSYTNTDKVYQIKLIIIEYKFRILAEELLRINRFTWDEKYTHYLVDQLQKGINVIDEYVQHNYHDLFIFTARLYTLKNLCLSFSTYSTIDEEYLK